MHDDCNSNDKDIELPLKVIEKFKSYCYPKSLLESDENNCIFYMKATQKRISYKNYKIPIKKVSYMIYFKYYSKDIIKLKNIINVCTKSNCINPKHLKLMDKLINEKDDNNDDDNNTIDDNNNEKITTKDRKRKRLSQYEYNELNTLIKEHNINQTNCQIMIKEKRILDYCKSHEINERSLQRIIKKHTYSYLGG
jgi:hypothetical protein